MMRLSAEGDTTVQPFESRETCEPDPSLPAVDPSASVGIAPPWEHPSAPKAAADPSKNHLPRKYPIESPPG